MSDEGCENSLSASPSTAAEGVRRIQIYSSPTSSSSRQVTPFWKDKYERDAKKYWDMFYRRHKDRFFKDRHYLDKEWGCHFQVPEGEKLVVLEAHKDFSVDKVNAFVCDLTEDNLSKVILPSSVDIVTMVFMLSAVAPEKMPLVLQNIKNVLKPSGCLLLRDYATGDLAQLNEINPKGYTFKIKGLAKEYQHTCKSTGLILWDSARLMCNILAENPSIVSGKKVLELGCGSAGICSMVAVHSAQLVVATDGDTDALDLLKQKAISNIDPTFINNMVMKKLMWGDQHDIEAIKDLYCHDGGFEVIVGMDVTYSPPAIDLCLRLLKSSYRSKIKVDEKTKPTLILSYAKASSRGFDYFERIESWIQTC